MTALFRRNGTHAAPLHESLPVAWRKHTYPARWLIRRVRWLAEDAGHWWVCKWRSLRFDIAVSMTPRALSGSRPGARPADAVPEGPATPLAGQGAALAETPVQAGAVPLIDTVLLAVPAAPVTETAPLTAWALTPVLYGERGEHPYPAREVPEDIRAIPDGRYIPERDEDWWKS